MKRYLSMLLILIWGCSTSTPPMGSSNSFPSKFKHVSIVYQNIPESWDFEWTEFQLNPPIDTSSSASGKRLFSGNLDFYFNDSSFIQRGDTVRGQSTFYDMSGHGSSTGVTLVLNRSTSMLDTLILSHDSDWNYGNQSTAQNSFDLTSHGLAFQMDSTGQILVSLSGDLIQNDLNSLQTRSNDDHSEGEQFGEVTTNSSFYFGSSTDSSSITICFIP